MAEYSYRKPDGEIVDLDFPFGKAPQSVEVDGVVALRDWAAEHNGRRRNAGAGWPMTCFASGVHPDQAGELRKFLKDRGCPTEVNKNGDPVYRDAAHRRKALRVRGMIDKQSYC